MTRPTKLLSWPPPIELLWLAIPIACLAVAVGPMPILPYDFWWPIVQGRAAEQLGAIPQHNLFLYTLPADAPFYNQPWLAQLLMWQLYKLGSHPLLAYTCLSLFLTTLLLSVRSALQITPHPRIVAALILPVFLPGFSSWLNRTQMFATPCFALFLWALLRLLDGHMTRRTWLLICAPLLLLWANLHGSVFLTTLLVIAAAGGQLVEAYTAGQLAQQARALIARWGPALAACILIPMLNPRGPSIYAYIYDLSVNSHVSKITIEWLPLAVESSEELIWLIWLAIPTLLTIAAWRRIGWARVFMTWGFAIMTFRSIRTAMWWPLVLMPILPAVTLHLLQALRARQQKPPLSTPVLEPGHLLASVAALFILILPASLALPGLPLVSPELFNERFKGKEFYNLDDHYLHAFHPLRIAPKLAQLGYPGRIYHDVSIAGYLEFMLTQDAPAQVAFADQRIELVPFLFWRIERRLSSAVVIDRRVAFARLDIRTALLNVRTQRPLQESLEADPDWVRVAVEGVFVLYMRADSLPDAWRDDPSRDLPIAPPDPDKDEHPIIRDEPVSVELLPLLPPVPPLPGTPHTPPDTPPAHR
jgi:hypothetical protein